jgi:hypothetical protein
MASFASEVQYVRHLFESWQDTKIAGATPFEKALDTVAPGKWYQSSPENGSKLLGQFSKTPLHRHKDDVVYVYRDRPDAPPTAVIDYSMLRLDVYYLEGGKKYSLRYDTNKSDIAAKRATEKAQHGDPLL